MSSIQPAQASVTEAGPVLPMHVRARRFNRVWSAATLAMVLLIATLFGLTTYSLSYHYVPSSDEATIFDEANWIAEHGGVVGFFQECLSGSYPYHNTNPGMHLLVQPFMARNLSAVRPARLIDVFLSSLGLVLVYALSRRPLGPSGAAVLTLCLAASRHWVLTGPIIIVEPLIYALFFAGWIVVAGHRRAPFGWWGAGAIVGWAWWIKASSLLLAFSAAVALPLFALLALRRLPTPQEARTSALQAGQFVAGFVLITWPLLVDRFIARGNPLYSDPSVYLWLDAWDEHHLYQQGLATFGLRQWVSTHTLWDAYERLRDGLWNQLTLSTRLFDPFDSEDWYKYWLGAILLLPAVWGLTHDLRTSTQAPVPGTASGAPATRRWKGLYTACLLAVTILLMAWYNHTAAERYNGVLGPLVGFLCIRGIQDLFRRWRRARPERCSGAQRAGVRTAVVALASIYALGVLYGRLRPEDLGTPFKPLPVPQSYAFLTDWLRRNVATTDSICLQTPYLYPNRQVHWLVGHDRQFINIPPPPAVPNFEALTAYAEKRNVRYLIIESDSFTYRDFLFVPYQRPNPAGGALFELPGWRLVSTDPAKPVSNWMIFERIGWRAQTPGEPD